MVLGPLFTMALRFVALAALVAAARAAYVDYSLTDQSLAGYIAPALQKTVSYAAPSTAYLSAPATIQKTYAYAAPAVAVISAPAVRKTISYSAPTVLATAAVPVEQRTVSIAAPAAAPVALNQEVAKTAVHQLHIANRQRKVRIEEYRRPEQLIRVHESAQLEPETVTVSAPAEPSSTIRVINHAAPASQVERVVSQQPGQQVFDIEKPAAPADRLIQITRAAKEADKVEFYSEPEADAAEIVLEENPSQPQVQYTGAVRSSSAALTSAPATYATYAAPATIKKTLSYSVPALIPKTIATAQYVAAPAAFATYAAPAVYHKTLSYAAPALQKTIAYSAPALQKTISYAAPGATLLAPALHKTISYSAPVIQKNIAYAVAPISATYATGLDTDFHAKRS